MVDMSPEAITARLKLTGELSDLAMKLMRSEPAADAAPGQRRTDGVLEFVVGTPVVIESNSPVRNDTYGVLFEDDGETGYFYACDVENDGAFLDALHIYNVTNVVDADLPSHVLIVWSQDGLKCALNVNDYIQAVFDFESKRGYCRTGFPPIDDWSKDGHAWSDDAIKLFA